ncbi:MAG: DUF3631 domain-containing protein [Chitinophagaceae bacterium]|nr:DUF3631 domain-containing protein [Chitinophagaceae bacterium]
MKARNNAADLGTSRANRDRSKPIVKSKLKHSEYLSKLKKMAGLRSLYRNYRPSNTSPSNNIFTGNNVQVPLPPFPPLPLINSVEHGTSVTAMSDHDSAFPEQHSMQYPGPSNEILLLRDIYDIFRVKKVSKIRTKNLIAILCTNNLWATYCSGKKINARRLSNILQGEFGIHSKDIRFKAGVFKGFYRKTIAEACRRFKVA